MNKTILDIDSKDTSTSPAQRPPPFESVDRSEPRQTHTYPCPELLQQALGNHEDEREGLHVAWIKTYRHGHSETAHEYTTVKVVRSGSQEAERNSFFLKIERRIIRDIGQAVDRITLCRGPEENLDVGDVSLSTDNLPNKSVTFLFRLKHITPPILIAPPLSSQDRLTNSLEIESPFTVGQFIDIVTDVCRASRNTTRSRSWVVTRAILYSCYRTDTTHPLTVNSKRFEADARELRSRLLGFSRGGLLSRSPLLIFGPVLRMFHDPGAEFDAMVKAAEGSLGRQTAVQVVSCTSQFTIQSRSPFPALCS